MNLNTIENYILLKAEISLDELFQFLEPALEISRNYDTLIFSDENKHIIEKFNCNNIEYQIKVSNFILNITHLIEVALKANLYSYGEYLIFESIDKYPLEIEKWEKIKKERRNKLQKFLKNKEKQKDSINHREWLRIIIADEDFTVPKSINIFTAVERLQNYLKWQISEEFKTNIKHLVFCRNEVIHFAHFNNITLSMSAALEVFMSLCLAEGTIFNQLATIPNKYEHILSCYNDIVQQIIYYESSDKIVSAIKNDD